MKSYSCCFTGHRLISTADRPALIRDLRQTLTVFAESSVGEFICGGALGFDTLAAEEVLRLKGDFPHIRLSLILPCRTQADRWTAAQQNTYKAIIEKADGTEYLFDRYVNGCMQMRNRRMVDRADVCVAYYRGTPGGTAYTVNYAKEKGIPLLFVPAKEEATWEI